MPYADNAGIHIHYEVEGTGPALVLHHGFTQCLEDWFDRGYVAALGSRYRLILVDARGHGRSDKPHDEVSYTLDRRVTDVTSVLDAVGVEKAHFWGYSMGGWIGFGMARHAPDRVDSLIIGGAHPFANNQAAMRQWVRDGITAGGEDFVAAFEKMVGPISAGYAARLRAADLQAWLALAQDRVSIEDMLGAMAMPCCIYAGEADPIFGRVKAAADRIPNAHFFSLPGLLHSQAFIESSTVLTPVIKFLSLPLKATDG